jgi:glycosyltransferase involved in cell wall biosynthesis
MPAPDVALVSLGTTPGLRRADAAFSEQLREAGVDCRLVPFEIGRAAKALRRNPAITDFVEALAARRTLRPDARVTVYSTVTAAFLQPRAGAYAVRFDSPAALNRSGISGAWQRQAERRALAGARCLLPWSGGAGQAAPGDAARVVLPVPVAESKGGSPRDIDALAYAGDPQKRGLDVLCRAWAKAGGAARLVVAGIDRERATEWLERRGLSAPADVEWAGLLSHEDWLATAGRARLFINASRREDYGISQLEALSAGAAVVTVPSAGPYEALPIARRLAAELVSDDLAAALAAGLALDDAELRDYRGRALAELEPYRPPAVQAVVAERVIPALGLA